MRKSENFGADFKRMSTGVHGLGWDLDMGRSSWEGGIQVPVVGYKAWDLRSIVRRGLLRVLGRPRSTLIMR